jgi:hypothetical protein
VPPDGLECASGGRGAIFRVRLPLAAEDAGAASPR